MLYLVITIAILAIVVIYWISISNVDDTDVVLGIPNWQPTVCDPFYQNCCSNPGWTYSDGYFYPLFVKNT